MLDLLRGSLALAVASLVGWATYLYVMPIIRRDPRAKPVMTTWILFATALTLSLFTYFHAPKHGLVTNFASIVDTFRVSGILILLWCMGHRNMEFTKLQIGSLIGTAMILIFWLKTGETETSNILTQGIVGLAYLPTYERLWKSRESTEPLKSWLISWSAGILALTLAIIDEDYLVIIYATRAVVQVGIVLLLIWRLRLRAKLSPEPAT